MCRSVENFRPNKLNPLAVVRCPAIEKTTRVIKSFSQERERPARFHAESRLDDDDAVEFRIELGGEDDTNDCMLRIPANNGSQLAVICVY